jgi:hypothetical protein
MLRHRLVRRVAGQGDYPATGRMFFYLGQRGRIEVESDHCVAVHIGEQTLDDRAADATAPACDDKRVVHAPSFVAFVPVIEVCFNSRSDRKRKPMPGSRRQAKNSWSVK